MRMQAIVAPSPMHPSKTSLPTTRRQMRFPSRLPAPYRRMQTTLFQGPIQRVLWVFLLPHQQRQAHSPQVPIQCCQKPAQEVCHRSLQG